MVISSQIQQTGEQGAGKHREYTRQRCDREQVTQEGLNTQRVIKGKRETVGNNQGVAVTTQRLN